ncbi:MAG: DNA repair protein RecN [Erysipelothrix sp.]|nr:DNA repair protein RecN [Erysipelothrix sp.]
MIENYILIEHLELQFNEAMSVFTGETGAGKSIFINALNLLCGSRLNSDIVGKKSDEAKIEGVFAFKKGSHAYESAISYDFDPQEDCVFSRTINQEGRSTYKINRQNVNLAIVRDILRDEIDIHSQFDTAYLRDEKLHLNLLDRFHQQTDLLKEVASSYQAIHQIMNEKKAFEQSVLSETQKEFLTFQLAEIKKVDPKVEEEADITEQLSEMSNFEQNHSHFTSAKKLLNEIDTTSFYQAIESLKLVKTSDKELLEIIEMMESSYYQLDEASLTLTKLIDKDVFDPYLFERLQERNFEYNKLKRKFQLDIEGLIQFMAKAEKQLEDSENQRFVLEEFDQRIKQAQTEFETVAKELSDVRHKAAIDLKSAIEKQLHDLSLPNAQFEVEFYQKESSKGLEDCRFLISVNKGQALQPLAKVASGGELSRFMLGMKVIFNRLQQIELVVFDEIDSGISGPVALQVGLKMSELSKECRVLTVTHLPAVASCGDAHYVVRKTSDDTKTLVSINELNDQERIEELAQMAFTNTSGSSLQAAQDLLHQAREAKQSG